MDKWTSRIAMVPAILWFMLVPAWKPLHGIDQEAAARMMRVTVAVACLDSSNQPVVGSGILVGDGGWVLTNAHIIRKSSSGKCLVVGPGLKVVAQLKDAGGGDLALLELASPSGREGAVFTSKLSRGQQVVALGYPDPGSTRQYDDYSKAGSPGKLAGATKADNGITVLQTDIAFNARNTGGPLFTICGEVAGINEELGTNVAIAVTEAYPLLQKNGIRFEEASGLCQGAGEATAGSAQPGGEAPSGGTQQPAQDGGQAPSSGGEARGVTGNYTIVIVLGVVIAIVVGMGSSKKGRETVQQAYQTVRYRQPTPTYPKDNVPLPPFDAAPRSRLVAIAGPLSGRSFALGAGTTCIGRDPSSCQIVLPAETTKVSRRHCSLRQDNDGSIVLEDCGSVNGTFLASGTQMESGRPHRLQVGERFYLGSGSVGFELHGADA